MRISDWSSDVCSSDLLDGLFAPTPDPGRVAFLRAQPFAHRGLHGNGVVENSRTAFDAAIRVGHGMECDVQVSSDGVPFVFHDDTLDRLTAEQGPVRSRSADMLDRVLLKGTEESPPRLSMLLEQIGGRAPLLVEIKARSEEHTSELQSLMRNSYAV